MMWGFFRGMWGLIWWSFFWDMIHMIWRDYNWWGNLDGETNRTYLYCCYILPKNWRSMEGKIWTRNHCFCWQNIFGCPAALKPPMMGTTRVEPRHVEGHTAWPAGDVAWVVQCFPCEQQKPGLLVKSGEDMVKINWLVVSTPLKNISQLGLLFPIYGKKGSKPPTSTGIPRIKRNFTSWRMIFRKFRSVFGTFIGQWISIDVT